ncbi:hypothetical protein [Nocardia camponoti]|uniref:Uncharacterized protein n=1 Tax=Nocardia camponoti TaxID=1616106 RepID=A0A917Q6P4_9NOCA|nr:hypothetical protein [Nocardia camponoti]GGK32571.1 hypothetical protein GCM10011591_00340 [Nocardia camponoti]
MPEPDNRDELCGPTSWDRVRSNLVLGQRLTGTVAIVPRPGAIGIVIDLGLPFQGFVDVMLLPYDVSRWPSPGTTTDFLIWWMDKRPQIRLVPADRRYRRDDFDTWRLGHVSPSSPLSREDFQFNPRD